MKGRYMLTDVQAIVLAAGKATRFNTGKTKLIEKLCGQEIILYPLSVLENLSIDTTLVIGFQGKKIKSIVEQQYPNNIQYVEQCDPNGTASATKLTKKKWHAHDIIVIKADIPLITTQVIEELYKKHKESNADISFVSAHNGEPSGFSYSRVIKKKKGTFIHKAQELSQDKLQEYCCVNGGIYIAKKSFLVHHIDQVVQNKYTGEFHFSDLVNLASMTEKKVSLITVPFDQVRSINTHQELWAVEQIKRAELIKYWMDRGVRFSSAQTVHMDLDVKIGTGSFIGCSVHLLNGTKIGNNCNIEPFSILENTKLGNNVAVHPHSIIRNTIIDERSQIGPFAHLHTGTTVGTNCKIGNFVETKQTTMENHTKAKHLTYLGNTKIGSRVNIGAGTITCNYNGKTKHTTHIEDDVFIGTNNSLVAPVTIHRESFTAAGSVITENVPSKALAIARAQQINKEGYASKLHQSESSECDREKSKQKFSFIGAVTTQNDSPITDQ